MAKKTTKTNASNPEVNRDVSPAEPAKRAVAKLAGSVKKKIKSVLEPKAPKPDGAKPSEVLAAGGQSNGAVAGRRKSREPGSTTISKKANRAVSQSKPVAQGSDGFTASEFTNDDVALRAYFLAQRRIETGQPGSPEEDWIEAERQLAAETGRSLVHS